MLNACSNRKYKQAPNQHKKPKLFSQSIYGRSLFTYCFSEMPKASGARTQTFPFLFLVQLQVLIETLLSSRFTFPSEMSLKIPFTTWGSSPIQTPSLPQSVWSNTAIHNVLCIGRNWHNVCSTGALPLKQRKKNVLVSKDESWSPLNDREREGQPTMFQIPIQWIVRTIGD